MKLNVGCGPFRTDLPNWINTDIVFVSDQIEPDIVVDAIKPLPFKKESFDQIYLGHVLEHIAWHRTIDFIKEVNSLLKPSGTLMIVGPDIYKSIQMYKEGTVPFEFMETVLEDDIDFQPEGRPVFGARHQWNAYPKRIERLLQLSGFKKITELDITNKDVFCEWPVTSHARWQMAAIATK